MNKKSISLTGIQKSVLILMGIGTFLFLTVIEFFLFFFQIMEDLYIVLTTNNLILSIYVSSRWIFLILVNLAITMLQVRRTYKKYEERYVTSAVYKSFKFNQKKLDIKVNKDLQKTVNAINLLIDNTQKLVADEKRIENSKDELITNVSHDIRTPLTSIMGYLGLIENTKNLSKNEIFKYTHIAFLKSQQMQSLVNDLFDYANTQQFDSVLNASEFDMGQLLEQFAVEYEIEANNKGIEIISKTYPEIFKMKGDTDKLGRVFNNLISNALKYGENAKHIWLQAEKDDKYAVIKISNDGKKIPNDSLEKLFDRFYRVEESRSKETGGSGLGLAIAQSMVKLHGGSISVESDDKITSFIVELPINLNQE